MPFLLLFYLIHLTKAGTSCWTAILSTSSLSIRLIGRQRTFLNYATTNIHGTLSIPLQVVCCCLEGYGERLDRWLLLLNRLMQTCKRWYLWNVLLFHRFRIWGVGGGLRLCDLVPTATTVNERCTLVIAVLHPVHRKLVRLAPIESNTLHGVWQCVLVVHMYLDSRRGGNWDLRFVHMSEDSVASAPLHLYLGTLDFYFIYY